MEIDRSSSISHIRNRVPAGYKLPIGFEDFLQTIPPEQIGWDDLDAYDLKPSALNDMVTFLRVGDGGLVGLWYREAEPAIALIGAHGDSKVLADNFHIFREYVGEPSLTKGKYMWLDIPVDDMNVPELEDEYKEWFKTHTWLLEPYVSEESELLRQRVCIIAEKMLRDGCSKVYQPSSAWWTLDFRIERDGDKLLVSHWDSGKWNPVPEKYKFSEEIAELLKLVKNQKQQYKVVVFKPGLISVDRDRELSLVPPDFDPDKLEKIV